MIRPAPLFALILFLFSNTLSAQQFTVSLGSFYQFAPEYRSTGYSEWQTIRAEQQLSGDTLYVLYRQQTPWSAQYTFHSRGGAQAALQLAWQLGARVGVQSGLGLRLHSYEIRTESRYGPTVSIPIDTLEDYTPSSYFPGTTIGSCTYYTNSYSDVERPRPFPLYWVAELDIPLRIDYALIPGALHILAGAHLRSPLFSRRSTEFISLERETLPNGDIACAYVKEERINRTGDYLRDATLAGSLSIQLWLGRLGLELEGQQQFSNRFADPQVQSSTPGRFVARPYEAGLKVLYVLK
ncbi:MAG: hypothetical protein J5I94_08280 [Phaeodactylibacter sp.]|nr:hypothetical protein [Phaeodactylibacter sp.]